MADIISAEFRDGLDQLTEQILQRILEDPEEKARGKFGGMCRIRWSNNPNLYLRGWKEVYTRQVGTRDSWDTVADFSQEKVFRLIKCYADDIQQISSWQSRNEARQEYGGAELILMGYGFIIISFSGLSEHADELFGILPAQKMGWGDGEQYAKIITLSGNTLALRFLM